MSEKHHFRSMDILRNKSNMEGAIQERAFVYIQRGKPRLSLPRVCITSQHVPEEYLRPGTAGAVRHLFCVSLSSPSFVDREEGCYATAERVSSTGLTTRLCSPVPKRQAE
jgi:hypothetical protein